MGSNVININFSLLKDMEVYALPTPLVLTGTKILRIFKAYGKEDKVVEVEQCQVVQRKVISIDEVLFHEFGHFLHRLENRNDVKSKDVEISISYKKEIDGIFMSTDISGDITKDWIDPEELRNGTGLVLMQDDSFQKDTICTYKCDMERNRTPRWPYRGTSTENKIARDFVDLVINMHK